jgi:hypothetical protein
MKKNLRKYNRAMLDYNIAVEKYQRTSQVILGGEN